MAMETFGVRGVAGGIEAIEPSDEEGFNKLRDALSDKITKYKVRVQSAKGGDRLMQSFSEQSELTH